MFRVEGCHQIVGLALLMASDIAAQASFYPSALFYERPGKKPSSTAQTQLAKDRNLVGGCLGLPPLDPCNYPRGQPVESDRSFIYLVARRRRTLILFYV